MKGFQGAVKGIVNKDISINPETSCLITLTKTYLLFIWYKTEENHFAKWEHSLLSTVKHITVVGINQ